MLSPGQQSSAGRGLRCALGAARAEPGVSGAGGRREKKSFSGEGLKIEALNHRKPPPVMFNERDEKKKKKEKRCYFEAVFIKYRSRGEFTPGAPRAAPRREGG